MKTTNLIFAFLFLSTIAWSQVEPVFHITFDDCTGMDVVGPLDTNIVSPSVDCDCGVAADAAYFNEEADSIFLDDGIKDLLSEDFTFSMYFWAEDAPMSYPLISIQRFCSKDSSFQIRYIPAINELDVQISKNFGSGIFLNAELDPDRCWHHVVFLKDGLNYSLTVDGVFIETDNLIEPVTLGEKHSVRLGSSPCLNSLETFARARIDQIKIFDRPLSLEEIQQLDERPDRIINRDTTIFAGSSVFLETGAICSPNFTWSPSTGLDDPNSVSPTATPDQSTLYELEVDHGSCTAVDNVNIFVIDEDDIDCNELLVPNVFTPNGDKINDFFEISNSFIIEDLNYFEIYDRWGAKLFSTQIKEEGWDGTFNGITQAPAMYIYKIEYTCQANSYQKVGSFSLLK